MCRADDASGPELHVCDRDVAQHNLVWQYEEGTQQLRHLGVLSAAGGLLGLMSRRDGAVS